ncbi:MAG: type I restriction-modification system subunit M N-terminal domain-containing protein [Lachnospiraceae bacterium]
MICDCDLMNTGSGALEYLGQSNHEIMSLSANIQEKAALIGAIADKLTGVYKPHEYGEAILPLTVLRRFDSTITDTKEKV